MTGSYINLKRKGLPPHCGFKPIALSNVWEWRICLAWRSNDAEVERAVDEWIRYAIKDPDDQHRGELMFLKKGREILTRAREAKTSPIFFIQDIRELITERTPA